jgi:hypothetical protein
MIKLLLIFNLLDAILTLRWLRLGIATEGNFLMAWLLESGEVYFFLGKMFLASIACLTFYFTKDYSISKYGLRGSFALYSFLMAYHLTIGIGLV